MKINFFLPHLKVAGGVRVILSYADWLAKNNHQVTVVVQSKSRTRYFFNFLNIKPSWFKNFNAKIIRIPDWSPKNIPNADISVIDSWGLVAKNYQLPKEKGAKFHFIQHDERLYHGQRNEVDKIYRLPIKKIVVSSWIKEIFKNDYKQDAELLLNSFDRSLFYPAEIKKDAKQVRILMLHHNHKWKGTEEWAEIVGELKKKYKNIKLIMFGVRQKEISNVCDEYYYNLPQHKLAELYSSADIYLCPSWDEGSGLPSMEAMACRCALVTYNNGGSRDYAFDGQTAMVAERRNKEDLKNKLELLIKDEELRKKISTNGFNYIQNMPTWKEQAEKLENIFKEKL
ncbi:MAG: glycosyltransferase family 4 protein [bacterium]